MSGYAGPGRSFVAGSREMGDTDCDCVEDGSFIIIPRQSNNDTSISNNGELSPVAIDSPNGGMDRSTNVFQLGQQAERAASMNTEKTSAELVPPVSALTQSETEAPSASTRQDRRNGPSQSVASNTSITSSINSNISSMSSEPSSLEEANTMLNQVTVENQKLKALLTERNQSMKRSLETYRSLQKEMSSIHDDNKIKYEESRVVIEQLREENSKWKEELKVKIEEFNQLTERLAITNRVVEQLQSQLEAKEEDIGNLRNAVDVASAASAHAAEALTDKDRETSLLQTQMALFKAQEEQLDLYKAQMEEYKANFEEERRDRVSMKERKDQMTDELTRVKVELENKTAELEELHRTHLRLAKEHVDRNEGQAGRTPAQPDDTRTRSPGPGPGDQQDTISPCPLCNKKFTTRSALLAHASHCGDSRGTFVFP